MRDLPYFFHRLHLHLRDQIGEFDVVKREGERVYFQKSYRWEDPSKESWDELCAITDAVDAYNKVGNTRFFVEHDMTDNDTICFFVGEKNLDEIKKALQFIKDKIKYDIENLGWLPYLKDLEWAVLAKELEGQHKESTLGYIKETYTKNQTVFPSIEAVEDLYKTITCEVALEEYIKRLNKDIQPVMEAEEKLLNDDEFVDKVSTQLKDEIFVSELKKARKKFLNGATKEVQELKQRIFSTMKRKLLAGEVAATFDLRGVPQGVRNQIKDFLNSTGIMEASVQVDQRDGDYLDVAYKNP